MTLVGDRPYAVPALSEDIDHPGESGLSPGTNLLVTGPGRLTSTLVTRLALDGRNTHSPPEGVILVSTNTAAQNFLRQLRAQYPGVDESSIGFVDATGRGEVDIDTEMPVRSVSSTGDLTGISIGVSVVHSRLKERGFERLRYSFDSLSYMLLYRDAPTMTRFVHTISGRISATDGLGLFTLDPSMHNERISHMLGHTCDGRIHVDIQDGVPSFRIEGLTGYSSEWYPLEAV